MNSLFLATDLSLVRFTGSRAPAVGGEFDRLLDYRLDTYWRSSYEATQELIATQSVGTINAVGVVGQNFDELFEVLPASITLKGSSVPTFATSESLCSFSASSDPQVYTFPAVSYQYLRVEFSGTTGAPRIAQFFVGNAVQIDAYLPPFRVENIEARTVEGLSLEGAVRTSILMNPRVRAEVRFAYLTEATRSAVADLVEITRGRGRPFFFRNHEGVTRFVRFAEDYSPVDVRGYNLNETQTLVMRTQDVSGFWNLQGPNATASVSALEVGPLPDLKYITSVS